MRSLSLIILAALPFPALAEDFALTSDVGAVTLYPQGATITRQVPYSIPAGQHQLILTDLPRSTPLASVRVAVEGAAMGSVTARRDFVPPRTEEETAALQTARAEVERLEDELRDARAAVDTIRLEAEAARARVAFLEKLGEGEGVTALDIAALRDLSAMIGEETLAALRTAQDAERRADAVARSLEDLEDELKRAKQAEAALVPEEEDRAMLAVAVSADAETDGVLTVTYNTDAAGWEPVYDLRLDRKSGALTLERGAYVAQSTGENWQAAELTLSTVRPSEQTAPSEVWPWLRRIYEEPPMQPVPLARSVAESDMAAGAAKEEALAVSPEAIVAAADFDGLSVTYSYPGTVDVATGADRVRLALGTLETQAETVAKAVPLNDPSAFLVAEFTNDTGELILPTAEASFYLDGRFVGQRYLDLIPAGEAAELSFGPIDGLRLLRTVEDRAEGDRGVISKSNRIEETVRIEVENLTGESWPLRVLDRVPVSEQEDLKISWEATPTPAEETVDDKRGVLAWEFELGAGERREIRLSHTIKWPDGMVLR
ncbi:hypothetical protein FIU89_01770 [Roseovarius sp. THAF27]|uniref:DUF4139 domain-containing protein n=1 Tax=Roseovarius sp. THAF27 TaxID=2587850 RepID=UPI0012693C2B|nr:DUF4139 domain-containing protein [Roseovarius sp. THAF27]QFT79322.1 hypothetical protein FIU89_01770 [Roseovarius sp. THAF27]